MKKMVLMAIACLAMTARAEPLKVQCGVPPLVAVVQAVGGDRVNVHCLMDGKQDACTYSPSAKTIASARSADLFVTAGMPFEVAVAKKLTSMNPAMVVVDTSSGLEVEGDPHIWMSLTALQKIAGDVAEALSRADPSGAAGYRERKETYCQALSVRHERVQKILAPVQGVMFYVYHPVFGHFANDYGLVQQTVELDGKSPSPKYLLSLINRAHEENVRVIFVQPQFSMRPSLIIAKRIDGEVVPVDPLAEDTPAILEQAAESIAQAYAH